MLQIVARGPSLPIGINRAQPTAVRLSQPPGKADPIWDTAFEPKFQTPVKAGFVQPIGSAKTLEGMGSFLSRVAEINAIAASQHLELPTIREELAANGASVVLPSADDDAGSDWTELGARHLPAVSEDEIVAGYRDTQTMAALQRRIDWEKYTFACGPVRKAELTVIEGKLSIREPGRATPDRDFLRDAFRVFVRTYDVLPDPEQLADMRAFAAYYENKPVLAHMGEDLYAAWYTKAPVLDFAYGEDHDPLRTSYVDVPDDEPEFEGVPALGMAGVEPQPCWDCGEVLGHSGYADVPQGPGMALIHNASLIHVEHAYAMPCQAHTWALLNGFGFEDEDENDDE